MNTNSRMMRCLSIFILVLSLTPMASFYVLMTRLQQELIPILMDQEKIESIMRLLQSNSINNNNNPAATIEELWSILFPNHSVPTATSTATATTMSANSNNGNGQIDFNIIETYRALQYHPLHHMASICIVPWVLFLSVIMIISCLSCVRSIMEGGFFNHHNDGSSILSKKQRLIRKQKLQTLLQPYQLHLTQQDFQNANQDNSNTNSNEQTLIHPSNDDNQIDIIDNYTMCYLPHAGTSISQQQKQDDNETNDSDICTNEETSTNQTTTRTKNKHGRRLVPVQCAICLTNYKIHDQVTWSSNTDCIHCFHTECIISWLSLRKSQYYCPCCRQTFCNKE